MTVEQRVELERMAVATSLLQREVMQARALLWAADGVANDEIGRRCGVDSDSVRRWRCRFVELGVAGVGIVAMVRPAAPQVPFGWDAMVSGAVCAHF